MNNENMNNENMNNENMKYKFINKYNFTKLYICHFRMVI
jgi:hypothetical protein